MPWVGAHAIIACDAGVAVTKRIKQTASALLREQGLAFTLMNGGRFGSTTRAWALHITGRSQVRSERTDAEAHHAPNCVADESDNLVELAVPRPPGAGAPFPPHMAW